MMIIGTGTTYLSADGKPVDVSSLDLETLLRSRTTPTPYGIVSFDTAQPEHFQVGDDCTTETMTKGKGSRG